LRRARTAQGAKGRLPTFITIGAMKSGTSALHQYLQEHPQIEMSRRKETDFFFRPDQGGHDVDWYRSHFTGSGEQFGESSPNYTKRHVFDGVAERMHAVVPDIRLIYLVRDPIDRAVSHYEHIAARGRTDRNQFEKYFENFDNPTLKTSRYAYQLEPYVETFGMERILVIASERLRDDRRAVLRRVFSFLGVDPDFTSPSFDIDHHVTPNTTPDGEVLEPLVLPELDRQVIADHLRSDINRFRSMVGQDFAHWSV
jgi:hypothetical protein